ncbi:MAG: alpha-galactosidase, partial [Kiritimatiellae bacterium]|nr:alpha-galactosidase [Kiritimatiellia bacterium]
NRELIALDQDPLCLQAYVAKRDGETYVLVKDIETYQGTTRAVAFLNTENANREMSIDLKDIELAGKTAVRDLFERKDLSPVEGKLSVSVPGHATRIYRLTAEKRLERRIYEGETAWMETYQELKNPVEAGTAYYKQVPEASGGVVASQVGGKGGPLVWRHIWSAKGGTCDLALRVVGEGSEGVRLSVNGKSVPLKGLSATVDFKKGDNEVKVFGDSMLPDIDCLVLSAVQ